MSSRESPALRLELRPDALAAGAWLAWTALLLVCLWHAELFRPFAVAVSLMIGGAAIAGVRALLRAPGTVQAIARDGAGRWFVSKGGAWEPVRLMPASRVLPGAAVLDLRGAKGRQWVFLRRSGGDEAAYRRLRAQLRMGEPESGASTGFVKGGPASQDGGAGGPGSSGGRLRGAIGRLLLTRTTIRRL